MEGFTNKDVQRILGISKMQVIHWTKELFITPEFQDANGVGTYRLYSKRNILEFALAKILIRDGISLSEIRHYFTAFKIKATDLWDEGLNELNLSVVSDGILFYDKRGKFMYSLVSPNVKDKYKQKGTAPKVVKPNIFHTPDYSSTFIQQVIINQKNNLFVVLNQPDRLRIALFSTTLNITGNFGGSIVVVDLVGLRCEVVKQLQ